MSASPFGPSRSYRVDPDDRGLRLDRWLAGRIPEVSRTRLQEWIRDGRVRVNQSVERPSFPLEPGQVVEVEFPPPASPTLAPHPMELEVLWEDPDLLVVNKPSGLQVHPGAGPPRVTLVHGLLARYPGWVPPGSPERPGIVHRLDRDTSGLLLVARTPRAWRALLRQISEREVTRRYVALVWGRPERDSGIEEGPIGRDPRDRRRMAVRRGGRPARTAWQVLRRFESLSLLELTLSTGRTHQIRVHLSKAGHPVFGDPVYGGRSMALQRAAAGRRPALQALLRVLDRQGLHAYHLAFRHPARESRLRLEAPVPADLEGVLVHLLKEESAV